MRRIGPRFLVPLALSGLLVGLPAAAEPVSDEQFIESLGERYTGVTFDRQRLARLFFGAASTLDGGKSTLEFLHTRIGRRDPGAGSGEGALSRHFAIYSTAVEKFRAAALALLDAPGSSLELFRVMSSGFRACTDLEGHVRMLDAYGVGAADLASVLSSSQACERFRRIAFQPRVEGLILEVLASADRQGAELEALRAELRALEQLVQELDRIEAQK